MTQDHERLTLTECARAEVQSLTEMRKIVLEEHSHSFRWLMASLLAINAGAAIAILNSDALAPIWKIRAGAVFSVGCLFSLLIAVTAQRMNFKSLMPIQQQIGYWVSVGVDGVRNENQEAEIAKEMQGALKLSWLSRALGWLAALAFSSGLVVTACGLAHNTEMKKYVQSTSCCRDDMRTSQSNDP